MIVNETRQFSYLFSSASVFSVSTSLVTVYRPDGTTVTSVTLSVQPGTSSATQSVFTSPVPLNMAGRWLVVYSLSIGGEIILQTDKYYVTYNSIYNGIRTIAAVDSVVATDSYIDSVADIIIRTLEANYPNFVYRNLSFQDSQTVDTALTYLCAIPIFNDNPKSQPYGNITKIKLGDDEFNFTVGRTTLRDSVEDWDSIADDILSSLPMFDRGVHSFALMTVGGRRENDRTLRGTSSDPYYRLFTDEVINWETTRANT